MTIEEINQFFTTQFSEAASCPVLESLENGRVRARLPYVQRHLRPGGTMSGPSMMMLADAVGLMSVMVERARAVEGVTSNLNIHFLSRPQPGDLLAYGELLRLGRRQAVVSVTIYSDGEDAPVASATVTYALPPADDSA